MDLHTIGLQIKHFRLASGITQKELADKIGTTWEMVSRYETGKSSPMRKILDLADALNIPVTYLLQQTQTLEDTGIRGSVPLLDKPFTSLKTALANTKSYYTAPDWILHTAVRAFAIDSVLVKIETSHIESSGILFVSTERPISPHDLVITQEESTLSVHTYSSQKARQNILGVVVAWEKRFR